MSRFKVPRIRISIPFLLLICLLYVGDLQNVFVPTMIAVCIHELGHITAIMFCGGTIEEVDIKIFGARIFVPELAVMPYRSEIIIAAAGPAAGLLTAVCSAAAAKFFKIEISDYFIGINIVISAINMIPVYPLDGGRITLSTALLLFSLRCANIIYCIMASVSAASGIALCIALAMHGALNPTIVIFTTYVAVCAVTLRPRI